MPKCFYIFASNALKLEILRQLFHYKFNLCFKLLKFSNAFLGLGSDEGAYAWVVANYALGTLGGNPKQTTGIIELGGASAQV